MVSAHGMIVNINETYENSETGGTIKTSDNANAFESFNDAIHIYNLNKGISVKS